MREAVMRLAPAADHLLIDAVKIDCDLPQKPIIHGDALSASIAAASILAKVERDRIMCEWDAVFPAYGLASHKGYSTPKHLAALRGTGAHATSPAVVCPGLAESRAPGGICVHGRRHCCKLLKLEEVVPEDLAG